MIPKQAIEKAIEGGWQPKQKGQWEVDALHPAFWQALGKALGWKDVPVGQRDDGLIIYDDEWKYWARRFYDLILTGGNAELYWQQLLTDK